MELRGWHQVAFERDLTEGLNAAQIGNVRLVVSRSAKSVRTFRADCPHRGAHLAHGGRLVDGDHIVCPFHGHHVRCGSSPDSTFSIPEYNTLLCGGLLFVKLAGPDLGFEQFIEDIHRRCSIIPGFTLDVDAPSELVIENAFDATHFKSVHGVRNDPQLYRLHTGNGSFAAQGSFELPSSPWQRTPSEAVDVPFLAHSFSPGLVVSSLGGLHPYYTITSATPRLSDTCTVRFSLATPRARNEDAQDRNSIQYLLKQSRGGILQDMPIWQNLSKNFQEHLLASDRTLIEFRSFCKTFYDTVAP